MRDFLKRYTNFCEVFYPSFAAWVLIIFSIAVALSSVWCSPCISCSNSKCEVRSITNDGDLCNAELRYTGGSRVAYFSRRFDQCPDVGSEFDCFRKEDNGDFKAVYFGRYDDRPFHEQCPEWTGVVIFVYVAIFIGCVLLMCLMMLVKRDDKRKLVTDRLQNEQLRNRLVVVPSRVNEDAPDCTAEEFQRHVDSYMEVIADLGIIGMAIPDSDGWRDPKSLFGCTSHPMINVYDEIRNHLTMIPAWFVEKYPMRVEIVVDTEESNESDNDSALGGDAIIVDEEMNGNDSVLLLV